MARKIPHERIGKFLKAVLTELKSAGGEARLRDLFPKASPKLDLTEYEKAAYEKSGQIRWQSVVHFYSISCVKAGYLVKSGGKWKLTAQGEKAIKKQDKEFIIGAIEAYRTWKESKELHDTGDDNEGDDEESDAIVRQTSYDQAFEQARQEIESHISNLGPYDFQNLVSELLIAMGYHVRHVAPPGPDGGIDIVVFTDPIGAKAPRIIVQVKHRQNKAAAKEVRELDSLLRKEGDVGLFVSSGGFTTDAEREVRSASRHIDTMDLDRLITLWEKNYDKLRENGKALLPLVKLHFLAPTEE